MKKIAILTCLKSVSSCCTGASCISAFNCRTGAFQQYQGEVLELSAFFQCNGCEKDVDQDEGLREKLDRILKIHPDAVHVGVCTLKKDTGRCGQIEKMMSFFQENEIPVINGTHGSARLDEIGAPIMKK